MAQTQSLASLEPQNLWLWVPLLPDRYKGQTNLRGPRWAFLKASLNQWNVLSSLGRWLIPMQKVRVDNDQ